MCLIVHSIFILGLKCKKLCTAVCINRSMYVFNFISIIEGNLVLLLSAMKREDKLYES